MSETLDLDFSGGNSGDQLTLGDYAERAYLDYAISVVKGRALPDVCDGQKPVQRRILHAMNEMGLGASAKPVKSARVVGDVLGKFHPHGDQAAYDAMVRMAQDFSLRYPLVDGQGNFGSRDGDGAAAMRYTEARLTPIARLLLDEIDQGTVDFQPNYDGSTTEPKLLPARLPMVLLNGASGIAVGMATEIPPHNLGEVARAAVAMIRKPNITVAGLMEHIAGPDFPGGAQIISATEDIAEIYATGRGSLKTRARWKIEDMARGQWQLVVTELPPNVSAQKVLEEIEELTNPKVKTGKKSLTAEQQQLKQQMLALLDRVRDEAGRDAAVRLVFEPKTKNIDQDEFINTLLAHTSLESSVSVNLVMIGSDGKPKQKPLGEILYEWIGFRFATVTRRCQHRLGKVDDRIHILEGRLIVYLNIDKVIKVIRESDEPKPDLIRSFKLTDRQAEDILEIRLRQLARMESIKIEQELAELRTEKGTLEDLLTNPKAMQKQVIKEIEADEKTYGDKRRTLIEAAQKTVLETKVIDEPVTVIISERGWVRARQGHGHEANYSFKAGDALYGIYECRTVDHVIALASNGRSYSIPVTSLPGARGDGVPLTTLIDLEDGSRMLHMVAGSADTRLAIATALGNGFVCQLGDMISRIKAGKQFIALEAEDQPLRPAVLEEKTARLACLSAKGRLLIISLEEIKELRGGGRGVILMELDPKETLLGIAAVTPQGLQIAGTGRGGKEQVLELSGRELQPYLGKRARKGKVLDAKIKPTGFVSRG
ncbi:MAG: DNA topoisomerase IV subunit A [Burkholderiaceae bacterium]|nr:MAG: DNA topoisomerase IV subunit A [Burkholderiaceae bacterium]